MTEDVNAHNLAVFGEMLASDYARHSQATTEMPEIRGIEAMQEFLKANFTAFPDWHEKIELMVAEGDKVAYITTGTGTHTGPMGDIPPTAAPAGDRQTLGLNSKHVASFERPRSTQLSVVVLLAVSLAGSAKLHAQAQSSASSVTTKAYLGVGMLIGTDDAAERVVLPSGASRHLWFIEGMFMPGRTGVGAELSRSRGVSAIPQPLIPTDEQNETLLLGTFKVRASRNAPLRLDLVGAAGLHVQRRETVTLVCAARCNRFEIDETDVKPAFAFGADVPLTMTPHVAVSGVTRLYFLRRSDVGSDTAATASAVRFAAGITGRFGW